MDDDVALSAVFWAMGYALASCQSNQAAGRKLEESWGVLATGSAIVQHATRLEALYRAAPEDIKDNAVGVWAYEVAEPMGRWFGMQTAVAGEPDAAACDAQMKTVIEQFFVQDLSAEEAVDVISRLRTAWL